VNGIVIVDDLTERDSRREKAIRVIKYMLFSATVAPVILGSALTYDSTVFSALHFFLAAVGLIIGQAGGDYLYYYFTHNHTHARDAHTKIFAGWRPFFTEMLPEKNGTLYAGIACLIIDLFIGYYFYLQFGYEILFLALAGGLVAVFFTPLMLIGLKEVVVFITFGPLSLTGLYFVLSGQLSTLPAFASLPMAFLVTIVAYLKGAKFGLKITEGKKMVIKLNRKLISALTVLAYLSIVILVITYMYPVVSLAGLLGLIISISVLGVIRDESSEIHDYLWAVVRSIFALLVTTILISLGFII
jgi:1,4-dihydroxy-2-naphthoate octaprenyltransferase